MIQTTLTQLQPHLTGSRLQGDAEFVGVSTDSRNVAVSNLFVALKGERFDAHDYLAQVTAQGAVAVLAERLPDGFNGAALIVPDTRIALGEMATWWRQQYSLPVIAVTGSNGKTTVKEMIAAILAAAYGAEQILATRGNLNNEIGVPLTVLRLDAACRAAVIELGMNHPGEIAVLSAIAQANVGLVNNAQREHQEFMASVAAVAEENAAVIAGLPADGIAVFPSDDSFTDLWRAYAGKRRVLGFGFNPQADVYGSYTPNVFGSDITVTFEGHQFKVQLAAAGEHNVRNALAAAACALAIGIESDAVRKGLEAFVPVNGRLQRKIAANGALVIDDTYNANPDSVRAAIDVLVQAPAPRFLVLGDMGEVGDQGPQFHREVGAYAATCGIENLFTLGEMARDAAQAFGEGGVHFSDIDTLNVAAQKAVVAGASVLVKGSRFMKMERVVAKLLEVGQSAA